MRAWRSNASVTYSIFSGRLFCAFRISCNRFIWTECNFSACSLRIGILSFWRWCGRVTPQRRHFTRNKKIIRNEAKKNRQRPNASGKIELYKSLHYSVTLFIFLFNFSSSSNFWHEHRLGISIFSYASRVQIWGLHEVEKSSGQDTTRASKSPSKFASCKTRPRTLMDAARMASGEPVRKGCQAGKSLPSCNKR